MLFLRGGPRLGARACTSYIKMIQGVIKCSKCVWYIYDYTGYHTLMLGSILYEHF